MGTSTSNNSISDNSENDKNILKQSRNITEIDKEYLAAVENEDMETAQRLVNEAARKAGYNIDSSYQGTSAFS